MKYFSLGKLPNLQPDIFQWQNSFDKNEQNNFPFSNQREKEIIWSDARAKDNLDRFVFCRGSLLFVICYLSIFYHIEVILYRNQCIRRINILCKSVPDPASKIWSYSCQPYNIRAQISSFNKHFLICVRIMHQEKLR